MTNWIIGPRQSGRSTELIELAAAQDLLIVAGDQRRAACLAKMAEDSGLKIRNPVSFSTWLRHPALFNDYKLRQRGILVDDADFVLECLLRTSVVYAVAESGEYVRKPVLENMVVEVQQ